MTEWLPTSADDVATLLHEAARLNARPRRRGGLETALGRPPIQGTPLKTSAMTRVLEYEPRDLTICLEAGVRFATSAHAGGAPANAAAGPALSRNGHDRRSGCRRPLRSAATPVRRGRDQVIGMVFATMEGKLVTSGGKVVKNVAGLDMQKAVIGSYGTLGVITQINFKLAPLPESTRTFVVAAGSNADAAAERSRILAGPLQPAAVDAVNAEAARALGLEAICVSPVESQWS